MSLSNSAIHLWEEVKSNRLVKYGPATAITAITPLAEFISQRNSSERVTRGSARGDCVIPLRRNVFSLVSEGHYLMEFYTLGGLVLLRKWIAGGICRCHVRLDGRTVVITGANTGIGKETAIDMAMRGARIVMACRDLSRAEKAAAEIRRSTGNGNIVVRHLDLASLISVRQFAHEFAATENRLDILINNAGVMMCPKSLTEDGYETQFAVNHLGHFLLTVLLLDMLKNSAPSRVVNVSSIAHKGGKIHFDDLNYNKAPYDSLVSYRQSKLANLLFTQELARRLTGSGVTVYALHPGVIRTELGRYVQTQHPLLSTLLSIPAILLMKTPKQGAQTSIYCAVAEGLEPYSGCYFSDCKLREPAPEGKDHLAAMRLWEVSSRLVGYNGED